MPQSIPPLSRSTSLPSVGVSEVGPRFAFIQASWHQTIVHKARDGFIAEMLRQGVARDAIDVLDVPGAFELPLMAKRLARSGRYDAIIACALVVDGGIYRHDFVAQAVVQGLMAVQLESEVPYKVCAALHRCHAMIRPKGEADPIRSSRPRTRLRDMEPA